MAVQVESLAAEVNKRLAMFAGATDDVVKKSVDSVTKATVSRLKETSPRKTGAYAKSWKSETIKAGRHSYAKVIHAGDGEYRLTHLLEHGHQIVTRSGAKKGFAKAYPHIQSAEEAAIEEFELMLRQGVEAIK